jgi:dipeptidyl-peptidase 4
MKPLRALAPSLLVLASCSPAVPSPGLIPASYEVGATEAAESGLRVFEAMGSHSFSFSPGMAASLTWLPGGRGYLESVDVRDGGQPWQSVDPVTGRGTPLLGDEHWAALLGGYRELRGEVYPEFTGVEMVMDGRALHLREGTSQYLYDRNTRSLRRMELPDTRSEPTSLGPPGLLSPDFEQYAFVRRHDNLYVVDTRGGEERQLVVGTSENNLVGFLGVGPWYAWSPDGRYLAYVKADPSGVSTFPLVHELSERGRIEMMRYPFTTDPNPEVELWVVDLATDRHLQLAKGTPSAPYLRSLTWLPGGRGLSFQVLDQWESRLELRLADPASGTVRTLLVDEDSTFLDPPHNLRFLEGGARFLWSSQRTGWRHLYLHDTEGAAPPRTLTRGDDWEVGQVIGVDEDEGWVYFYAHENHGLDRRLLRVSLDGGVPHPVLGDPGFHTASMDPAGRYLVAVTSALGQPPEAAFYHASGERIRSLARFDTSGPDDLGLTAPELVTVVGGDGVTPLVGMLYKPADFDPGRSYPLLVQVYGGPHAKAVRNAYATTSSLARLSQLGFIVAEFDGRGTPFRGKRFQAGNYMALGTVDVDDQAAAVREIARRPYVDGSRVGVMGLSHGGYMTLMMMMRYPDVFHVGVAAAPMTEVSDGPRQYVGRFMRTPGANPEGYDRARVMEHAANLQGRLLIAHGTHDQNVFAYHTMRLVQELIEAGKPVDMMIYPEGAHVFQGVHAQHFYLRQVSYFLEHLRPLGWEVTVRALWSR